MDEPEREVPKALRVLYEEERKRFVSISDEELDKVFERAREERARYDNHPVYRPSGMKYWRC